MTNINGDYRANYEITPRSTISTLAEPVLTITGSSTCGWDMRRLAAGDCKKLRKSMPSSARLVATGQFIQMHDQEPTETKKPTTNFIHTITKKRQPDKCEDKKWFAVNISITAAASHRSRRSWSRCHADPAEPFPLSPEDE